MSDLKDTLFLDQDGSPGSFRFDENVARVFNDMISRSVPGYRQILSLLPTLTRIFNSPDSHYYDLGCSTGAGLLAMAEGLSGQTESATLIGIDNSEAMVEQARKTLDILQERKDLNVEILQDDITAIEYSPAAMILLNFTLQFIALEKRSDLLAKIWQSLKPGGCLVLSEKLVSSRPEVDAWLTRIHHQYKADQGYSSMEISKKRDAIENVLVPESLNTHLERLHDVGFKTVFPWVRNLQFISLLAVK